MERQTELQALAKKHAEEVERAKAQQEQQLRLAAQLKEKEDEIERRKTAEAQRLEELSTKHAMEVEAQRQHHLMEEAHRMKEQQRLEQKHQDELVAQRVYQEEQRLLLDLEQVEGRPLVLLRTQS